MVNGVPNHWLVSDIHNSLEMQTLPRSQSHCYIHLNEYNSTNIDVVPVSDYWGYTDEIVTRPLPPASYILIRHEQYQKLAFCWNSWRAPRTQDMKILYLLMENESLHRGHIWTDNWRMSKVCQVEEGKKGRPRSNLVTGSISVYNNSLEDWESYLEKCSVKTLILFLKKKVRSIVVLMMHHSDPPFGLTDYSSSC